MKKGQQIRNQYEIQRFFKKLNRLNTLKKQQKFSCLEYKTLK